MMQSLSRRDFLKQFGVGLAGLGVAGSLAACAVPAAPRQAPEAGGEAAPAAEQTEISFYHWAGVSEAEIFQSFADSFMEANPNTSIKVEHTPADAVNVLRTRMAANTAPDVIGMMNTGQFESFAARQAFLSLDPYLEADAEVSLEDFYPILVEETRYCEVQYALPRTASAAVLYYNKELFDEAGLPYPDETWNWDTMLEAAQALTKGEGDARQWGTIVQTWLPGWEHMVWEGGGAFWNEDYTQCLLDDENSIEAVQWYYDLRNVHQVTPSVDEENALSTQFGGGWQMFISRRIGFLMQPDWMRMTLAGSDNPEAQQIQMDLTVLPEGPAGRAAGIYMDGVAISAQAGEPDASWAFTKWLTNFENIAIAVRHGRGVPGRVAVADTADMLEGDFPQYNNKAIIDQADAWRYPARGIAANFEVLDFWNDAFTAVSQDELKAAEALTEAAQRTNDFLAEQGGTARPCTLA